LKRWPAILAVIGLVQAACAQDIASIPTAQQLLDDVVFQLPREPLDISGDLILRKRHGVVLRELKFQMLLKWGENPAVAQYVIQDTFGREVEQLTVTREQGKEPVFKYSTAGGGGKKTDLFGPVQGTDVSWMDLTLSFLWWKGGQIVRQDDEIKGRSCYVVEVSAPAGQSGQYAKVRIWIDAKLHMLLQAEGLDANGRQVRILWVRSFKKIHDRWMLKDLEIQASPEHRTKLVVREVNGEQTGLQETTDDNESGKITPIPLQQDE
jgi:hypothetical protein